MKQSTQIQGIITDINLMDWHDDMHELFEKAQDALESLLIGLERFEEDEPDDNHAHYMASMEAGAAAIAYNKGNE